MLSDLGERGFLVGVEGTGAQAAVVAPSRLQRLFKPREKIVPGVGAFMERLYRRGGWVLFTKPARIIIALVAVAGVCAFVGLIVGRFGTPFVVASKFGIGGLVFLAGRFLIVAVHETAHGLTMASFGRKIERAGIKLIAIFPYAFVDTSEAWFEPRRRRLAVSGAGPLTDALLAGVFSLVALLAGGVARDVAFQLALGAYLGMLLNLNPLLERDGYHLLEDALREPSLRRRAREHLAARLAGRRRDAAVSRAVTLYGMATLAWSGLAACFAGAMALRFAGRVTDAAAVGPSLAALAVAAALVPAVVLVVPALRLRRRSA